MAGRYEIYKAPLFFITIQCTPRSTACSSITSISNVLCNNAALKKKVFTDTCDRATQTSPKPLKRPPDMRGNKLKLNIQSVASPYLNLNLR